MSSAMAGHTTGVARRERITHFFAGRIPLIALGPRSYANGRRGARCEDLCEFDRPMQLFQGGLLAIDLRRF